MMSNKPDFIDNLNGNTMSAALRQLLGAHRDDTAIITEPSAQINEARIATAYFSPEGFVRIAPAIAQISSIKLLLGSDPIADYERWQRKLGESENKFITRKLSAHKKNQEAALRTDRDHIPFTRYDGSAIRRLVEQLRAGNIEVRRYEDDFLHAKAYIFTSASDAGDNKLEAVIAGSSNLTAAGLSSNLELNLGRYDAPTVAKATIWFDQLWDKAQPFDLAAYFDEMFQPKTPFEIFVRVLWELYGEEVDQDFEILKGLPLTSFQKHGVVRALRLINKTGGVIVADEVGLGKTFIAGEILAHYRDKRQRALLICPAALRDTTWKKFISDFEIYLEVVSFEQLSRDEQLWDAKRRPNAKEKKLNRDIDEYQLVIIDEAHNYRNPDSPTRADALRALLYGQRKDLLMLTATPVNNSLWDLYHLTRFFLKQDAYLADIGILSIKERFEIAMKTDPNNLSPDVLYPIVDATTVKRTRQFIKKHYSNDQVKIDGKMQTIVFPDPKAISVRYKLDSLMPGLFDLIESYFDPASPDCILFARYMTSEYLLTEDPYGEPAANVVTGLLLSGLLKRFESSTGAFIKSIGRLIKQHMIFLHALEKGYVVTTKFFKETTSTDDENFDEVLDDLVTSTEHSIEDNLNTGQMLNKDIEDAINSLNQMLDDSDNKMDASLYKHDLLRKHVDSDLAKLKTLFDRLQKITPANDPKLKALISELEIIATQAKDEASSNEDETNKRKVIIFSFFADTVRWIEEYLQKEISTNPKLACYRGRTEMVVGSGQGEDNSKALAAAKFAPKTAGQANSKDETDILISTDVLAEGVNLQQARHIINYDMPWNPMRLVQRHGRIDRIGSQHNKVFMRTIFPVDRLDTLLGLEERISKKIAMAAASVGIVSPISSVTGSVRDFTETKEEIQKLLQENASLYERGGTKAGTQSGEEYRQTLRRALEGNRNKIVQMSWKSGSGMRKGTEKGIFFCATVGTRTYLRFVHAEENWDVKYTEIETENQSEVKTGPKIDIELGRCLRVIECEEDETLILDEPTKEAAYDLWLFAREDIHRHWMYETDPVNLQPQIRRLNRDVAEFIRKNKAATTEQVRVDKALDIIESPWSRRDERRLRRWFECDLTGSAKTDFLIENVIGTGLDPFIPPDDLPVIAEEDIKLLVWMGITV